MSQGLLEFPKAGPHDNVVSSEGVPQDVDRCVRDTGISQVLAHQSLDRS